MVFTDLDEVLVLTQKTVSGEDRVCTGHFRRGNDRRDIQIALVGFFRTDTDGHICLLDIQGIFVRPGIDRHRFFAHLFDGPDRSLGDLAPVRDQNGLDGFCHLYPLHSKQRGVVLHHLSVFHQDLQDLTAKLRFQFVKDLHRL